MPDPLRGTRHENSVVLSEYAYEYANGHRCRNTGFQLGHISALLNAPLQHASSVPYRLQFEMQTPSNVTPSSCLPQTGAVSP